MKLCMYMYIHVYVVHMYIIHVYSKKKRHCIDNVLVNYLDIGVQRGLYMLLHDD